MIYKPFKYQSFATKHFLNNNGSGLFMEMGLGKTVVILTGIDQLIKEGIAGKTLIIAPKRVARDTWPNEIKKWDHLKHLDYINIIGTQAERNKILHEDHDIYIIGVDLLTWLIGYYGVAWPFKTVIVDESSKFKSSKSQRFKALRSIRPKIRHISILTGTPRPNNLIDLWSQMYLVDRGYRLGDEIGKFRTKYCIIDLFRSNRAYQVYNPQTPEKGSIEETLLGSDIYSAEVYDKISDVCISMKNKDYLELPERFDRIQDINLGYELMQQYEDFEDELIMQVANEPITAANAAVLCGKLLQFSNGAIYDDKKVWHKIHDEKLDRLEEIVEEAQGSPVLIFYSYRHDLERIMERLKRYKPRQLKTSKDQNDWDAGKIQVMLSYPVDGVNLQAGGNIIIWFGLNWSLEKYMQANARLHRQGQLKPVIIHHLLSKGTMDYEVYKRLHIKASGQNICMQAVKARIAYIKQRKVA